MSTNHSLITTLVLPTESWSPPAEMVGKVSPSMQVSLPACKEVREQRPVAGVVGGHQTECASGPSSAIY